MEYIVTHGHSPEGKDCGAVSKTGQTEAKTNRNVAKKLIELRKAKGNKVYYLNENGKDISPRDKVIKAQAAGYDIWIEVHHNKDAKDKGNYGTVFYDLRNPKAKVLAQFILDEFAKINNVSGIRTAPLKSNPNKNAYGILNANGGVNIITEFEFLSVTGTKEIDTLTEQHKEAEAINEACNKYEKWIKLNK